MKTRTKRTIGFLLGAGCSCAIAWFGGYDFNERGEAALTTFVISVALGGLAAGYPFKDK